jgi:hypothetical protein
MPTKVSGDPKVHAVTQIGRAVKSWKEAEELSIWDIIISVHKAKLTLGPIVAGGILRQHVLDTFGEERRTYRTLICQIAFYNNLTTLQKYKAEKRGYQSVYNEDVNKRKKERKGETESPPKPSKTTYPFADIDESDPKNPATTFYHTPENFERIVSKVFFEWKSTWRATLGETEFYRILQNEIDKR